MCLCVWGGGGVRTKEFVCIGEVVLGGVLMSVGSSVSVCGDSLMR